MKLHFMKSPLVRWLIVLNFTVLCCIAGNKLIERHRQQQQLAKVEAAEALLTHQLLEYDKISPDTYNRLYQINKVAEERRALSDEQLSFVLPELTKTYDGKTSMIGQMTAELTLACMKSWSSAQEQSIAHALMPLLNSNDPDQSAADFNHSQACTLLAHFGAREAVPNILPLLDSPSLRTRSAAKQALRKLGYTAS